MTTITRLIGVYNADGGLVGEARYVVGHLLGLTSCSLCDITHSPIRRKPEWDAMVQKLSVPITVVHKNELSPELSAWLEDVTLPVVVGVDTDGDFQIVVDHETLDNAGGSVQTFREQVETALSRF